MSLTSAVMFVPTLLFDPRGTISRRAFALAGVPIVLLWFLLQLIWFFAWAHVADDAGIAEELRLEAEALMRPSQRDIRPPRAGRWLVAA